MGETEGGEMRKVLGWIGIGIAATILIATFVYRFLYPELTETQLFSKLWVCYLVMAWNAILGYLMVTEEK